MKKLKELKEGLGHKVPVYHADRKTLVGHVSSGATSIGAAKLAKRKHASFERVNGTFSWVASDEYPKMKVNESKYGDAMTSRLPSHLEDPRIPEKNDYETDEGIVRAFERARRLNKKALSKFGITKGFKESTWEAYRDRALQEAALDASTSSVEAIAEKHGRTVEFIEAQLKRGIEVEHEHTTADKTAREIALDHLGEKADYYSKLDKANLEEAAKPKPKKKFVPDPKVWKKMPALGKLLGVKLEEAKEYHVLKGHPYHYKSDNELHYIMKDAHEAEKAVGTHDKKAMWKYADQQNDAATILGYRKRGGKQLPEPKKVYTEELTEREKASHQDRIGSTLDANHNTVHDKVKKETPVWSPSWKKKEFGAASKHFTQRLTTHKTMSEEAPHDTTKKTEGPRWLAGIRLAVERKAKAAAPKKLKEEAPHAGHQMFFNDRVEHQFFGGKEARAARDAYAKHLKSKGINAHLSSLRNQILHGSYGHVYSVTHHHINESVGTVGDVAFNESGGQSYKVGDHVIAKIGPHKGEVHKVIHVHDTGHINITPEKHGFGRKNRYHLGAARAHPEQVERVKTLEEEKLTRAERRRAIIHPKDFDKKVRDDDDKAGLGSHRKGLENKKYRNLAENPIVREAFEAAKDKKKENNLKPNDFQEPKDLKSPGQQDPQQAPIQGQPPQFGGKEQDKAPEKQSNTPKPEKKTDKLEVKGPGPEDQFQKEPVVTGLTSMVKA